MKLENVIKKKLCRPTETLGGLAWGSEGVPGARLPAPRPCWRCAPPSRRGCPATAPASAGPCCACCLNTGPSVPERHTHTLRRAPSGARADVTCVPHLQGLPASGQLQLDVLLSQVASVLLGLQPLLQRVLVAAEGQGDLREGRLQERPAFYTYLSKTVMNIWHE